VSLREIDHLENVGGQLKTAHALWDILLHPIESLEIDIINPRPGVTLKVCPIPDCSFVLLYQLPLPPALDSGRGIGAVQCGHRKDILVDKSNPEYVVAQIGMNPNISLQGVERI